MVKLNKWYIVGPQKRLIINHLQKLLTDLLTKSVICQFYFAFPSGKL